jgi:hypothetical protein
VGIKWRILCVKRILLSFPQFLSIGVPILHEVPQCTRIFFHQFDQHAQMLRKIPTKKDSAKPWNCWTSRISEIRCYCIYYIIIHHIKKNQLLCFITLCLLRFCKLLYSFPHMSQDNFFTRCWLSICAFKWACLLNFESHLSHLNPYTITVFLSVL